MALLETTPSRRWSVALDGEVVELDHGVRLRPEPDLAGLFEGLVLRVEHLVAVVPDGEVITDGLHLERVPGVGSHLDALVQERAPAAIDRVVDGAVVLVGVAAGDVVVVGVLVTPDETEALVDLAGQRPRPDAEGDVSVAGVLEHRHREAVVRRVGAFLEEDVVLVRSLLDPHDPSALGTAAGPAELEAGGGAADRVGLEVSLLGIGRRQKRREGHDHRQEDAGMLHRTLLRATAGGAARIVAAASPAGPEESVKSSSGCLQDGHPGSRHTI